MDKYVSPKIKTTVKKSGSLVLLLFYSSLVDFYYIGPYIHNTLSRIKFFTDKTSVKSQDIEKNFLDINTMLFDTISFFNGFNRNFAKDMEAFLKNDVVYNERIFLNLRGISDSDQIMDMCRYYSGGIEYKRIVKSEVIKPKEKSKENNINKPKKEDKIKVEQSDSNIFKFLRYQNKVKRKRFLDEEINMIDFPEFIDDYERCFLKINFADTSKKKTQGSDILEVYDFINNITNTNKEDQNITRQKTYNLYGDSKNKTTDNKNNEENKTKEFDFLSMFDVGDKNQDKDKNLDKNNDKNQDKDKDKDKDKNQDKDKKENENNKEKEKEFENFDLLFDFSESPNNESNTSKPEKKEDNNKNINTKQSDKKENNKMLFNFDKFQNPNQKKTNTQISQKPKIMKKEEKNKNEIKKENKAFGLVDELEDSKRKEGQKSMEKNNVLVDNEKESDEKANIISKKITLMKIKIKIYLTLIISILRIKIIIKTI